MYIKKYLTFKIQNYKSKSVNITVELFKQINTNLRNISLA